MNELINLITQKTGLSNDMAQQVVQIVEGYLKDKLPEPMASQLTSALGSQSGGTATTQNMFGSKGEDLSTQH
jgi:hypothetical protein